MFVSTRNTTVLTSARPPWFWPLLFLTPILFCLVFAFYGWSQGDDGFILGYSWRLFNGEEPYRDFIYVRPPLSPLLHSFYFYILPDQYIYLASRIFVVLQLYIYSLLAAKLLFAVSPVDDHEWQQWLQWGCLGFFVSATAFTPMPWHTIDGVLFAVLSFYWLTKPLRVSTILSALFLLLALLTKQSFYPLLPLFPLLLLLQRRYQSAGIWLSTFVIAGSALYVFPSTATMLARFHELTIGISAPNDAIQAGVFAYLESPLRLIALTVIFTTVFFFFARKRQRSPQMLHYFLILLSVALALSVYLQIKGDGWLSQRRTGLMHALLIMNVIAMIHFWQQQQKELAVRLCALTAIAWCASISWGFQTPVLFSTPLIVGAYTYCLQQSVLTPATTLLLRRWVIALLVALALVIAWQPYGDRNRDELSCHLGTVSPKLFGIKSHAEACRKLDEAKRLAEQLDQATAFLPAFDLAYFLFDRHNPLPLDWPMVAEIGNANAQTLKALTDKTRFVVIDRAALARNDEIGSDNRFYVPMVTLVQQTWKKTHSGNYYDVYQNPGL